MKTGVYGKFVAPLLLALALAGCSRLTVEPEAGMGSVTLEVATAGLAEPMRTMAPAPLTAAELANTASYTMKVSGTSRFHTLGETVVALDASGRATLPNIQNGQWQLTLTAYDAAGTVPLLSGSTTVEVRGLGARASFVLTPRSLAGNGSFNVDISWSAEDRDLVLSGHQTKERRYELGLYSLETGEPTAFVGNWTHPAGDNNPTPQTAFTWSRRDIPAGQYLFKYTVTGGGLPDGVALCWQDNVYIEPGRETRKTVTIPQMAFVVRAPTNFAGVATAFTATSSWGYTGTLTWDSVYNGAVYELELLQYSTVTARPTSNTTWETARIQAGSVVYSYNSIPGDANNYTALVAGRPRVKTGNLLAGVCSIELDMSIASGQSYTARLRTVGSVGPSDWVYLAAPLVPATPVGPSGFTFQVGSVEDDGSFNSVLNWTGGLFDAGGTYELELRKFTDGTEPTNDTTWTQNTGTSYLYTATTPAPAGAPATLTGTLEAGSSGVSLAMRDTSGFYAARIRTRNSGGGVSPWVYLADTMIPAPTIYGYRSTRGDQVSGFGTSAPRVWHTWLQSHGPVQVGNKVNGFKVRWIRWGGLGPHPIVEDEAMWTHLSNLGMNGGSGQKTVTWAYGVSSEIEMRDMNLNALFIFCIRTETAYGNSPWYFYRDGVVQAP